MVKVKIYIEGGGEGKDLDIRFREAWNKFFKTAGFAGRMPRPIRGGSREKTFDAFCQEVRHQSDRDCVLLLVDSEIPVKKEHTVWEHLKVHDSWEKPSLPGKFDCFLMIQSMETWLLADLTTLSNYFGPNFKRDKIPAWTELEAVPKDTLLDILRKSSAACIGRQYSKGRVSFELLARINPTRVAEQCPAARKFLDFLALTIKKI